MRKFLLAAVATAAFSVSAQAAAVRGVSDTEITIGT